MNYYIKKSHFTRTQRASCCLLLLYSAMLASAMFYQEGKTEQALHVGPFKFTWREIIVSILSAIVIAPVTVLVVKIFQKSKPRSQRRKETFHHLSSIGEEKRSKGKKKQNKSKQKQEYFLPHWCKYVAWTLCVLGSLTAALFVVFCSMQFGKEKSYRWLTAVVLSCTQDILVSQPLRLLVVAVIIAYLRAKRASMGTRTPESSNRNEFEPLSLLSLEKTEKAREHQKLQQQMFAILKEAILFIFFLLLLLAVCLGGRDGSSYYMTSAVDSAIQDFEEAVGSNENFWDWIENNLIVALYGKQWYNGWQDSGEYIENKKSVLVGIPRLRQLRINNNTCSVPKQMSSFVQSCYGFYTLTTEDKTSWNIPGWIPLDDPLQWKNISYLSSVCPKPWRYVSKNTLNTGLSRANFDDYGGGGFVAELGYDQETALKVKSELQTRQWIDRRTRAIMTELSIFNPGTNLVGCVKLIYEIHPVGSRSTLMKIELLSLAGMEMSVIYLTSQLFLLIMIIYYLVVEIIKLVKQKKRYFLNFWNLLELLQIASAIVSVALHIAKEKFVLTNVTSIAENPYATISFNNALSSQEFEMGAMSFAIFTATVKLLKMVRFNFHVVIFSKTIRKSFAVLLSFAAIFFVLFLAFAQVGFIIFGANIEQYSSIKGAISYQLQLVLGTPLPLYEMEVISPLLSKIFAFSFLFSLNIYLMNMFIVIVNDAYVDASDIDKSADEFKMADFMIGRLAGMLPITKSPPNVQKYDDKPSLSKDVCPQQKEFVETIRLQSFNNEGYLSTTSVKDSDNDLPTTLSEIPHPQTLAVQYLLNKEDCILEKGTDCSNNSTNNLLSEISSDLTEIGFDTYSKEKRLVQEELVDKNIASIRSNVSTICQEKSETSDKNKIGLRQKGERLLSLTISQIGETLVEDDVILHIYSQYFKTRLN